MSTLCPSVWVDPHVYEIVWPTDYTSVFSKYSSTSIAPQLGVAAAITASVGGLAASLPVTEAAPLIGYTGCVLAVVLMASPLATISTVLRTKSTAAMPFVTSLATFFNASAWTAYGSFVAHDPIIVVPNALGLAASLVQLSLFARFGIHSPSSSKSA